MYPEKISQPSANDSIAKCIKELSRTQNASESVQEICRIQLPFFKNVESNENLNYNQSLEIEITLIYFCIVLICNSPYPPNYHVRIHQTEVIRYY